MGQSNETLEEELIEKYKVLLLTSGLLPVEVTKTLKLSKYEIECQHCKQKLRLAKLGCGDKICVDCLDSIFDLHLINGDDNSPKLLDSPKHPIFHRTPKIYTMVLYVLIDKLWGCLISSKAD